VGFALFTWGIAWLVAEGLALDRRARFSLIVTTTATFIVVGTASLLVLASEPLPLPLPPEPRPDTAYWDLETGSRIAYTYVPAKGRADARNPIVFLHGGPGLAVLDTDIAFFSRFSERGFDVYLYDQVGSGLSGRLEDVETYTIWRHVEDLEAIRETIDADRLILIGHAEGSELAARYMIEHRDRVERVIFYSPTPLWNDRLYFRDETRTAAFLAAPETTVIDIRPIIAETMAAYSPRAAQAYVSQREMTAWADRNTDERIMVCPGDAALAPDPESPGYNPYVQIVGNVSANRPPDPRPALKTLFSPTILLRGECGPVDTDVVPQYQDAIPYTKAYYVQAAGSMLHLSRPDTIEGIVADFLDESPR
jgi:proline iminopeptidase